VRPRREPRLAQRPAARLRPRELRPHRRREHAAASRALLARLGRRNFQRRRRSRRGWILGGGCRSRSGSRRWGGIWSRGSGGRRATRRRNVTQVLLVALRLLADSLADAGTSEIGSGRHYFFTKFRNRLPVKHRKPHPSSWYPEPFKQAHKDRIKDTEVGVDWTVSSSSQTILSVANWAVWFTSVSYLVKQTMNFLEIDCLIIIFTPLWEYSYN
jgi:hypothetical protein